MPYRVIGYDEAKNLMKQLDWKMALTMVEGLITEVEVYHPISKGRHKVRKDAAKKLCPELRVICSRDHFTAILGYDHDGTRDEVY